MAVSIAPSPATGQSSGIDTAAPDFGPARGGLLAAGNGYRSYLKDPRQQNALYGLPTRSGGCPLGRRLLQRRWIGNSPSGSLMGNDAVAFYFRHAALSIPDAIAIATMSEG